MLAKRQKIIVAKIVAVIVFTILAVFTMYNVKDFINRRESMLAMTQIGEYIVEYKKVNGSRPSQSNIEEYQKRTEGGVRLGNVEYRAIWINYDAPADTILAYVRKNYHTLLLKSGVIVLRLDGKVEWMEPTVFENQLKSQQTEEEIKNMPK